MLAGADRLEALRSLDADVLLKMFASHPGLELGAIVDGEVIPEQPQTLFREGRFNRVDILLGFNEDESSAFAPYIGVPSSEEEWRASAEPKFGAVATDYLQIYGDLACEEGVASAYLAGWRDLGFGWPMRYWARASESFGNAAFLYYFSRQPPDSWGQSLGAYHAAEISYVFANGVAENAVDQSLSNTMQAYWSNFARNGDPNGEGLPVWPRFGTDENYLELGDTIEHGKSIHDKQLDFWDNILVIAPEDNQ
jgi:para-nitrobenzyl esterase